VPLGSWDIRRASLAGLGPRLRRFMDKIFEDATKFLRSVNSIGVEIDRATIILDMEGFDMKTHACPQCIQIFLYFFSSLSTHYPGVVDKIYFINTPKIVNLIWDFYKEVFTPQLKSITTVYSLDKKDWKEDLRKFIPESSLSRKLGGDKVHPLEFFYIRAGEELIWNLNKLGAVRVHNDCEKDLKMYETLVNGIDKVVDKMQIKKNGGFDYCPNQF
jgi:hypothetical protein